MSGDAQEQSPGRREMPADSGARDESSPADHLAQSPQPSLPSIAEYVHSTRRRLPWVAVGRSFYFAFAGLWYLLRSQRNARIEIALGCIAGVLGAWLHISRVEWAIIVFTIALVLILEGVNTSIEAAVDLASPRLHPLAKHAKDLAAGMVLLAAMASIAIGCLILLPPLWLKLFH